MGKLTITTKNAPAAIGPYSQGIDAGGLVFVSGQIPANPEDGTLVSGNVAEETGRVLDNVGAVLAAAGLSFDDVVKTTVYLRDMADFAAINEVYARYFSAPYPARACVAVAGLPKDVRVEIEAVAQKR